MNDELKTKEYLKTLEQITLADSTRVRMREELLSHARFHIVPPTDISIKSPFNWLLLRTSQMAAVFLLVCGVGAAVYFGGGNENSSSIAIDENGNESDATETLATTTDESENPTFLVIAPQTSDTSPVPITEESADSPMSRQAMMKESADTAQDEAVMVTMLSQGEMNIEEYRADILLREQTYRSLVTKYKNEVGTKFFNEVLGKLDAVASVLDSAKQKEDTDARGQLDAAMTTIGEIESSLSLLGIVTVENGVIVDVDFNSNTETSE